MYKPVLSEPNSNNSIACLGSQARLITSPKISQLLARETVRVHVLE